AVSVEAVGGGAKFNERTGPRTRAKLPKAVQRTRFFSAGKWHRANVYLREHLKAGHKIKGAAIIVEPHQTIVVEPEWQAQLTPKNHLILSRTKPRRRTFALGTHAD